MIYFIILHLLFINLICKSTLKIQVNEWIMSKLKTIDSKESKLPF